LVKAEDGASKRCKWLINKLRESPSPDLKIRLSVVRFRPVLGQGFGSAARDRLLRCGATGSGSSFTMAGAGMAPDAAGLPILEDRARVRLGELSSHLGNADCLDDAFSAGDLLTVTVLRRLSGAGILEKYSKPPCLCRPWRSATRLRRSIGGFHWQATNRLTKVALEVALSRRIRSLTASISEKYGHRRGDF
jgi:hypothetical protein